MAVLRPGTIDDDGNWLDLDAMAVYMEAALPEPHDPEDSGRLGRRQFLIAISTGVIDYLRLHESDGFETRTTIDGNTYSGTLEIK